MSNRVLAYIVILLVGVQIVPASLSQGCITITDPNYPLEMQAETAIIVWDSRTKTEQFIRDARFSPSSHVFGFIVPTPTVPKLDTIYPDAFEDLYQLTRPGVKAVVHRRSLWQRLFGPPVLQTMSIKADPENNVEVLEWQSIGDYDVVSIRADDGVAIGKWLTHHHFQVDKRFQEWVQPYVKRHWILTAFKIEPSTVTNQFVPYAILPPVRMTFRTDEPFYPYREPIDASSSYYAHRELVAYVISKQRMSGEWAHITSNRPGAEQVTGRSSDDVWPPVVTWAGRLNGAQMDRSGIREYVKKQSGLDRDDSAWVTKFVDHSTMRVKPDDAIFVAAKDQLPVRPAPVSVNVVE